MNRAIASVYAISIGRQKAEDGMEFTNADAQQLTKTLPGLIAEIQRMQALLDDPWIDAFLKAKASGGFVLPVSAGEKHG